jgi:hypothetical protein
VARVLDDFVAAAPRTSASTPIAALLAELDRARAALARGRARPRSPGGEVGADARRGVSMWTARAEAVLAERG